jgi:hypothetical protein
MLRIVDLRRHKKPSRSINPAHEHNDVEELQDSEDGAGEQAPLSRPKRTLLLAREASEDTGAEMKGPPKPRPIQKKTAEKAPVSDREDINLFGKSKLMLYLEDNP